MVYKVHKSIFRRNISSLIVAAILLFLIFFYFGIDKILDQISKVPDWTIASVLLLYFLIYALLILKWKFIIDCVKKVNYFALIPIYLAGGMFNQLTPGTTSGGQPYRAYHLRKLNHQDLATNLSTTIFDFCIVGIVQGLLLVASLFYIDILPTYMMVIIAIVAAIIITLTIVVSIIILRLSHKNRMMLHMLSFFYHFKIIKKKFRSFQRFKKTILHEIRMFMKEMSFFFHNKTLIIKTVILEIIIKVLFISQLYIIFFALGIKVPIIGLVIVYSISEITNFIMFTPGGIGIVEAFMIGIFTSFGIPFAAAAAVTTINRFFLYIYEFLFGYVSYVYLKNKEY